MKNKTLRYFYDCEFLEGPQKKRFLGIPVGETLNTIDLISIGVVSEDGRELYLVSKDFNLREAWNRYDVKTEKVYGDAKNRWPEGRKYKEYWIRENVLKPIFSELVNKWALDEYKANHLHRAPTGYNPPIKFTYDNMKKLIGRYGFTRNEIKFRLTSFLLDPHGDLWDQWLGFSNEYYNTICKGQEGVDVEMVGYYSAYDHVCLSWIYGKMLDLPDAMPMYTVDIKPAINKYLEKNPDEEIIGSEGHHALEDAKWTRGMYEFLKNVDCV
jgi:hypothetical protein